MVLDVCIYVGKGTVSQDGVRKQGLGRAIIKLLSSGVLNNGSAYNNEMSKIKFKQ
jgi:hypothetical protein